MSSIQQPYRPGICNIGKPELRVRKIFLNIFIIITIVFTITAMYWCNSILLFIALLFSSFCAIVLALEIRYQLCIIFGFFNLHNFKLLGHLEEVHDPENAKADRQKVIQIIIKSLAIALLYTSSIHFISQWALTH